ncbi:MAG: protein kinase [Myxococcaceae bacterium]|jgi:serine/threonine-protein kinase|nr:protein kinase [Myxococcaceae bacterium]
MADQVRCGVMYDTPAELQSAVGPRLEHGEIFVPYPDDVATGTEAFVDVMLESGAKAELDGTVKGPDFDDRGNTGVLVQLSEDSAIALKGFIAALLAPTESVPSGLFATTRFTRPKTVRTKDGQEVTFPPDADEKLLEPGTLLEERFRIEAHIASGGMGEVYRAAHVHLKRPVALKLLKRALAADPEMWARFQREAELVSQLESPHIVRVFDFGRTSSGQPFLAMEYVEGAALDSEVARGPLEPARVVEILRQVCEGLVEAHHLGVVHRDLKPANIVLGKRRDGTELAKILDFGIARETDKGASPDGRVTQLGMVVGTPMYLAPEQALAAALDERTDIYALGCVAYELLTGQPPFVAPELAKVISLHLTQAPDDLISRRPELSRYRALCDVVLKALAKSKADRFANVSELSKALTQALATAASAAPTEIWPPAPAAEDVWPPAPSSAPVAAVTKAPTPVPPPGPAIAPPDSADDFFSTKSPLPATRAGPSTRAPASERRARLEASRLPLTAQVLDELAKSREAFGVTGNRLLVVHVEVIGAAPGSPRALRCLARALMVARGWNLVVDAVEADRAFLLLGGEALATSARAALALVAMREAIADEATRGSDAGPATLRASVLQASTSSELDKPLDPRVAQKARALAAAASAGGLLLERQLGTEVADLVETRSLDQAEAIEVLGRRSRMASAPAGMVGREGVLQLLDKRLSSLAAGVVAPFVVRAPRGSGRSSLIAELANRARPRGTVVGIGRSPLSLRGVPFGAIIEVICAMTGVAPEARHRQLKPALEKLGLSDSTLTAALVIAGVVQLPHPFTAGQAAHALRAVLKAGAAGRPVVLLFDGMESYDGPSLETVRELLTRAAPKELTIGFVDPEVPLERLGSIPSVDVTPLTRADVAQWLTSALAAPPAASLTEKVFTMSAGVPGRMVDLTWWLHDRGLLRQQGGQSVLTGDVPGFDVDGLVRARLAVMPLEVVRLLEAAALCGDTFDGPTVSVALPKVNPQALQQAVQGRLLRSLPNRRWAFAATRLQQLVLEAGSPERPLMHQRLAAQLVEQARSAPASIDPVKLGQHLNAAKDGVRAAALWKHAAETALAGRALRDAIAAVRGWVEALGQTTPVTAELTRARVDALARAAGMALSLQDAALARTLVDEAVALQQGQELGSPELALSLARVHRSEARRARAAEALGLAEQRAGKTAFLALVEAEKAEAREQENDLPGAVLAWETSLSLAPAAEELGRWHGEVNLTARVEARLAGVKLLRKEVAGARGLLESSLTRWRTTNWPSAEARVLANLGTLCVHSSQLAEASQHFDHAGVAAAASGDLLFQAKMLLQQAKVAKKQGQAAQAKQLAAKARLLSVDVGWDEGRVQAEQL